jgi:hypothetical protein
VRTTTTTPRWVFYLKLISIFWLAEKLLINEVRKSKNMQNMICPSICSISYSEMIEFLIFSYKRKRKKLKYNCKMNFYFIH